jgi:hypothetical protein
MPRNSGSKPSSYNPSKPYSSVIMPRFHSPLGPTFAPSLQTPILQRPSLFSSIKEGFGWGVGTSIARNIFESKPHQRMDYQQTQSLTPPPPTPPNPNSFPPPPVPPSQNVSRQQNSIQQTPNSKNEPSCSPKVATDLQSSCSELEDLYTQCLVKENTLDECFSIQEKLNACLGKKK